MMAPLFAASILALVGASLATLQPSSALRFAKRINPNGCPNGDPSQQDVINAINMWNTDVTNVNSFVDAAPTLSQGDLVTMAQSTLNSAQDEPAELNVLACVSDLTAGTLAQAAANDLFANFGDLVITQLNDIISSPTTAQVFLSTINNFRCCQVLPDLDNLWSFTAEVNGVANQVPISAPRPTACMSVTC